jgi:DNA-binding XRE family transcriptional regulator
MSDVFVAVKKLISRSGMSYWNVSHKAGCSEATIYNWMTGRVTEPHLPTLIKVAAVFGKPIELGGEPQIVDAMPDTPASVGEKMRRAHEFVGLWRRWQ